MNREIEPGVIVFAVICLTLYLMLYLEITTGIFSIKEFFLIFSWLIISALIFWSLFINKYWGIFVGVSFITLFIIYQYEPKPESCRILCIKKSEWYLGLETIGVTGINTFVTLYMLKKYFMSP
jgi:uncharacterized membrane protein YgaE (UPF0421/DUF939 family)